MNEARDCSEEIRGYLASTDWTDYAIEPIIKRHMAKREVSLMAKVATLEGVLDFHKKREARLVEENAELKEHCNTVWQLIKPFLPACPASAKKLLEQAMEESKKLMGEGTHKLMELRQENDRLVEALSDLYDHQNGCPLPKYENGWGRAMKRAEELLTEHEENTGGK